MVQTCETTVFSCVDKDNGTLIETENFLNCDKTFGFISSHWNCESSESSMLTPTTLQISTASAEAIHDTVYIIWIGFVIVILALGVITAIKVIGGKYL